MKFELVQSFKYPFNIYLYAIEKKDIVYIGEFETRDFAKIAAQAYITLPKDPEYFELD